MNKKTCCEPLKNKLHNNGDNKNFVVKMFIKKYKIVRCFSWNITTSRYYLLLVSFVHTFCTIVYLIMMIIIIELLKISVLLLGFDFLLAFLVHLSSVIQGLSIFLPNPCKFIPHLIHSNKEVKKMKQIIIKVKPTKNTKFIKTSCLSKASPIHRDIPN